MTKWICGVPDEEVPSVHETKRDALLAATQRCRQHGGHKTTKYEDIGDITLTVLVAEDGAEYRVGPEVVSPEEGEEW